MNKPWKLGLPALLALACAPNPAAPTKVAALVQDNTGAFVPKTVTLSTVTDVVTLQGAAANLIGGARIVVDDNDPALGSVTTDAQLQALFLKDTGAKPTVAYLSEGDVLTPADFHSWNMVTTYYNFEQAYLYWQQVPQVPSTELAGSEVYYWPQFTIDGTTEVDNALFFSPIQGFVVLSFDQLQSVPLPMNAGVIAHEFSHRVFNKRVYGGASVPASLASWGGLTAAPGANVLKSIDEGLADYHAVGASCLTPFGCNPRFLQYSLDDATTNARDMQANDKCITPALRDAIEGMSLNQFTGSALQYQVGTVFASALYHAGESAGQRDVLERAVAASYQDSNPNAPGFAEKVTAALTGNNPALFSMGAVADSVLAHVTDPTLARALCGEFIGRLQLDPNEVDGFGNAVLAHCPAGSVDSTSCPGITPRLP